MKRFEGHRHRTVHSYGAAVRAAALGGWPLALSLRREVDPLDFSLIFIHFHHFPFKKKTFQVKI